MFRVYRRGVIGDELVLEVRFFSRCEHSDKHLWREVLNGILVATATMI